MTRPSRNAAKAAQDKIKAATKRDADHDDPSPRDNGDSDEYSEPADNGQEEKGDGDSDLELDEEEDDLQNEDEYASEDDTASKPKKRRAPNRKPIMTYQLSSSEVDRILGPTSLGAGSKEAALPVTEDRVEIVSTTLKDKLAPYSPYVRDPRPFKKKKPVHKKGELNRATIVPLGWKDAHQGPTSNDIVSISMQPDLLLQPVYRNVGCNLKDFRVVTEPADLDEYLPLQTTSKAYIRQQTVDIPALTSHYMETTEKPGVNDFYMLNSGLSVWALDWCPLPTAEDKPHGNVDYIAVGGFPDTDENCQSRDQLYYLGKQDPHPNVIQIWSMNCNTNNEGELQGKPEACLTLCILHSFGAVFDLKWCPYGNWMEAGGAPGELDRLGILAATFSDGTVRLFSIPDPVSLRSQLDLDISMEASDVVYIQYQEPIATLRVGEICCMSISWGSAERLAAAGTNGTVYVWDTKELLSQSKESLAEKDAECLDPIYSPQVHDVSIRSVDWMRYNDASIVPWIIVSCSYDGRTRYTDVRDTHAPVDVKSFLGVPMVTMAIPWAEGAAYADVDYGLKFSQLYQESASFKVFNSKGVIWDMSYSNYQPFTAAAVSDGRVLMTNPAYKARRGYGMVQNHLYQFEKVEEEGQHTMEVDSTAEGALQTQDDNQQRKVQVFRYKEEERQEFVSQAVTSISFFPANVAIQKVQWSNCFHSAAWLASGSAGGIVRIDNTLLRGGEGGRDNKLEYEMEAYRLKKATASGGPRTGKMGRPPKPKGEAAASTSKRGRGKATSKRGTASKDDEEGGGNAGQENSASGPSTRTSSRLSGDPSKSPERSSARQATRVAPIFARAASSSSLTAPDPMTAAAEGENEAASAPQTPATTVPKRRGRPPKAAAEKSANSGRTLLNMMRATNLQDGGGSVDPSGGDVTIAESNEGEGEVDNSEASAAAVTDSGTASTLPPQIQVPASAPDSARKKRGPYKTKKRIAEEQAKQNLNLKDMWGGGKASGSTDGSGQQK